MKKFEFAALLSCLSLLLVSCATTQQASDGSSRFSEGRRANVVLRFSSWDYTFMSKPFYAEDGFMQQIRRETLPEVLNKFRVERQMAVVVVGWQYNADQLDQLVSDWKTILGGCGFERVVILRAKKTSELNGSVIVEDARLPIRTAQASPNH
jgi:hypothetical protein